MGTRFGGTVDVDLSVADDGASATVDIRLGIVERPAHVRVRLRSGTGRPLASATVNGVDSPVGAGDIVSLPAEPSAQYKVVARFAG
jgi:hypothetical protein